MMLTWQPNSIIEVGVGVYGHDSAASMASSADQQVSIYYVGLEK
jgi:hypothetical protein